MSKKVKEVLVRILRTDNGKSWWAEYKVPFFEGMTVLDALNYIRERLDNTLAFRSHCRMGVCGSCAVVINGKPRLACNTQIARLGTDVVELKPLYNFPVIRDLVVDLVDFFNKHRRMKPYLIRRDVKEREEPTREYRVTPEEFERYTQFTYCIMCGACVAACPTVSADNLYPGPQALAQAYRYLADPRDEGWEERLKIVDNQHGVWRCHFAGACSYVCPKGVDPALAIQLLKKELFKYKLFKRKKKASEIVPPLEVKAPSKKQPPPFDYEFNIEEVIKYERE